MRYADISSYFDNIPLIYLATAIKNQPYVRAMALIHYKHKLWCCSPSSRNKVNQIRENNLIEFCLLAHNKDGFHNIRGRGIAHEIFDPSIREDLSKQIPFFLNYWEKSEDPEFILYRLDLDSIEYHPPGGKQFFIFDLINQSSKEYTKNFRRN